jgi:hypothetical protein
MLSRARLDDIINDTRDAVFINQWLLAKSQWTRDRLVTIREHVELAIEQSDLDRECVEPPRSRMSTEVLPPLRLDPPAL